MVLVLALACPPLAGCGSQSPQTDDTGPPTGEGGATGGGADAGADAGGSAGADAAAGRDAAAGAGGATGAAGADGAAAAGGAGGAAGSGGNGGSVPPVAVVAAGVRWFGRVDTSNTQGPRFSWSGTGFVARFSGTSLTARLNNTGGPFLFKAVVDGTPQSTFTAAAGQATYTLATGLTPGTHQVELYRQTEGSQGDSQLLGVSVVGGTLLDPPAPASRLIEVVGDSISCGYGTLGTLADTNCFATESHWDTYGAVTARTLGAELSTVAISGQGVYRNYGGDMVNTLPMVYARALTNDAAPSWDFRPQPQVVIVNLGTNDISNNKGDPGTAFRDAYRGLVENIRAKYPAALIVCIIAPLLSGTDLTTIQGHIRAVVDMRHAAGDPNIELFDMIQAQTADKAACAYHPNLAENQLMAAQLVAELRSRLGW